MPGSSVKSSFQFKAYKVDKISFFSKPDINVLARMNSIPTEEMKLAFAMRQPIYFNSEKIYVGGFDILFQVLAPSGESDPVSESKEDALVRLELGIAGVFTVEDDRLSKELEEGLVKIHIPAILMPYARSAMTSLLANAGFGGVIFPLVNIHNIAKEQMQDKTIQIIE